MGPGGGIVLDMGEYSPIKDGPGSDFQIRSSTQSDDPIKVLVAQNTDDPFKEVGKGFGTIEFDIENTQMKKIRFVKIEDLGHGPFNESQAGYDLDAVVNLSQITNSYPENTGCGCNLTRKQTVSSSVLLGLLRLGWSILSR